MTFVPNPAPCPMLQVARVSGVLPADGALDVTGDALPCSNFQHVMLYCTYTPGAAGGALRMILEATPYAVAPDDWYRIATVVTDQPQASGALAHLVYPTEGLFFAEGAEDPETFVYGPIPLSGGVQRLRVRCAEAGVVGTPGQASVVAFFGM
jgi:hypothetical protein